MSELDFQITGVEAVHRGLTPLLQFKVQLSHSSAEETVQTVLLRAQIQIQSLRRNYTAREKERLVELFGAPERWRQTLRNQLWTHAQATVPAFSECTEVLLPVPCTYDLNIASAKYFYALEEGEVSLLFLFSGTLFYLTTGGRLQAQQISWEKEAGYQMPVSLWREMMENHYPNAAWLYVQRDVFDRLYAYKRRHGLATWEQTLEKLLPANEWEEANA